MNLDLSRKAFGEDFSWGVSTAAYQIEGAYDHDGKGHSIWDEFTRKNKKLKNQNGNVACNHYHRFEEDVEILKSLHIPNYRFSLSWSRVLPEGVGRINPKGLDFYDRLIDKLLENNITPWTTLYHWDLPLALEKKGGWTNRDIIYWFEEWVDLATKHFGDRIQNWMVLNEPMVYTGAGYFLGIHAPGKRGVSNFLKAVHHSALCQSLGAKVIRYNCPKAQIGTTFSCSYITPFSEKEKDILAAKRIDALLNRLFIEPSLGMGYPEKELKVLRNMDQFMLPNDEKILPFNFDFIGVQNYTREVVKHVWYVPYVQAKLIGAKDRNVPFTSMGWEVSPFSIYEMLKKYSEYPEVKKILVTENGAAFQDELYNDEIADYRRVNYLKAYLKEVLKAKQDGVPVEGYFVWTLMDNFEWAEGYHPRFGLVYTDYENDLKRIIKKSGHWYRDFLRQ